MCKPLPTEVLNQRLLKLFLSWVILNLRVVAEGVETVSQLAYLGNYGCQIFQGYFFEKPYTGTSFEKKLIQNTNFSNAMHMIPTIKKTQKTIKNNSLI